MFCYNLLQFTVLFRLIEALVLTALALWSSAHVANLARYVIPVLLGPRFLFLLANAIVLSLLLPSRRHVTAAAISDDDISAIFAAPHAPETAPMPAAETREEEEVFEDKRVVSVRRTCGRSRSERMRVRPRTSPEIQRSETDVGRGKGEEEEGDEEFRRTIEEFIEKHWKFQKEESMAAMAIVAAN